MEELTRIFYNAPHEIYLEKNIALYFYLTGVSAASFVISTLAYVFGVERLKSVGRIGAVVAPIVLAIAPLFLIIDLLQPMRFIYLLYYFNLASPVTWGSILLILYPINCLIYLYFIYKDKKPAIKFFGSMGIPLAVAVHGYTGFILALAKGIALWNTPLMPVYFLISAMVSGTALLILISIIKERFFGNVGLINKFFPKVENSVIYELGKLLAVFIAIDLFIAFSDVILLFYSTPENRIVAQLLLQGEFSTMFLYVEVLLGMILPFVVLMIPRLNRSIAVLTVISILVMIGIWGMRYTTVVAGQYVPLM
ncbi:MAG: polysulfide reductase NrfD [Planctomycetota bacterium]|nr:polysulfide reductase NrfD [Planctomycetota bacterium]